MLISFIYDLSPYVAKVDHSPELSPLQRSYGAVILPPQKGEEYIIAAIDNVSTHFLPYVSIAMVRLNCDQQRLIKWYTVHLFFLNCHFVSYIDQWIYYTIMTYKNKIVQNIVALVYNGAEQGF